MEEPGAGGQPAVEGIVESSVYLGTATQMVVLLAGSTCDDGPRPERGRGRAPALPGAGDAVRLTWAPEHMHIVRETEGP